MWSRGGGPVSLFFQVCVGCGRGLPERRQAKWALCVSKTRKWARLAARVLVHLLDPPPALLRPPGVPSGGAIQWTQTHRAKALQRVPRSAQAGEAARTTHRPGSSQAPGWQAKALWSQPREDADRGRLPQGCRAPRGEDAVARSQLRLTLSECVLSTLGLVISVPATSR